jgi:DNA-binding transcriptional LysR family regulator
MIDLRRLQILREVARLGSFNRAADSLRITPSAVSQQISVLERSLGTPVARRSTRGVVLTDAGRVLVEAGDAIAAELASAEHEIGRLAQSDTGRLTVATFTSGGQRLLPAALIRFTAVAPPGVELTVLENEPEDAIPLVRDGAADLALVYHFDGPPPAPAGLTYAPLLDDPFWIVLPAGHRLAGRDSVAVADLAGERWVHGCLQVDELLGHYAAMAGFDPKVACRGTDYVFAQSLVRAGVGISMIPQVALTADQGGLVSLPLAPPSPSRFVGIVTPRRPSPLAATLCDALRATVSETVSTVPATVSSSARGTETT